MWVRYHLSSTNWEKDIFLINQFNASVRYAAPVHLLGRWMPAQCPSLVEDPAGPAGPVFKTRHMFFGPKQHPMMFNGI